MGREFWIFELAADGTQQPVAVEEA